MVLLGTCYIDLLSSAELHFLGSFQGYPTWPYLLNLIQWPYDHFGHLWPVMICPWWVISCTVIIHLYCSGLHCWQILNFTYAYALNFINRRFWSLFWLPGVHIGSHFHKKLGPYFKAWGSLLVWVAVQYPRWKSGELINQLLQWAVVDHLLPNGSEATTFWCHRPLAQPIFCCTCSLLLLNVFFSC